MQAKKFRLPNRKSQIAATASRRVKGKIWIAFGLGLGIAIFWHFGHAVSEVYAASLADPHFWFHLLLEGLIALYGFGMTFIVWTVLERMYKRMK